MRGVAQQYLKTRLRDLPAVSTSVPLPLFRLHKSQTNGIGTRCL